MFQLLMPRFGIFDGFQPHIRLAPPFQKVLVLSNSVVAATGLLVCPSQVVTCLRNLDHPMYPVDRCVRQDGLEYGDGFFCLP